MAMSLPILFFALLELTLRLVGFGGYPPTIYPVGNTDAGTVCITDNPGPASYFFANRNKPGSLNSYSFLMPKPKGVFRVFVCGESAAKGFPQPMSLAASAFLEAMLSDVWPDRKVEVINLGTTAVASFPVLGMMTEALEYEPDLVVIHCGNNEYFGAYGVASLHVAGRSPTAMRLHRFLRSAALVQWIDGLVSGPASDDGRKTLMEVMMGQSYTAPHDPLRDAAARNLRATVGEMIHRCNERAVPVMACLLAVNERDLAPLGEDNVSSLSPENQDKLRSLIASGEARLTSDPAAAAADFSAAITLYPDHARARYLLGRAQYATGRFAAARESFQTAIDLDPMPWRCTGPSNEAIREAAAAGGAVICDLRQAFREASPGGCVGWEYMDDHVHPTLAGQALTARAIVKTLSTLTGAVAVRPEALDKLPSNATYARRLGDNPYDRYGVAHTIRVVCDIPFFRKTNPEAFERFNQVCRAFEESHPPEIVEICRKWQNPATHPGAKRPITGMVGRALIRMNKLAEAESLYEIARRSVPLYSSWNLEYNYFMLVCRERRNGGLNESDRALAAECIARGRFLLSHGHSESGMAERYTGRLHQLRGEWAEAIPFLAAARPKVTGTDLVAVDQALVMSFEKTGRRDEALKLIHNGIQHSGEFAPLYEQLLAGLEKGGSTAPPAATSPADVN